MELVANDSLPDTLKATAARMVQQELGIAEPGPQTEQEMHDTRRLGWETIKEAATLAEHLGYITIVKPELTIDQYRLLPAQDREMLRDIAMRVRQHDAKGVRLGVEPLDRWERFRHHHGCAEGCPACEKARDELSTGGAV